MDVEGKIFPAPVGTPNKRSKANCQNMTLVTMTKITTQVRIPVRMPIKVAIIAPTNQPVESGGIQTENAIPKVLLSQ